MVLTITQETYNEAVQENINEFGMSLEDAIEDTVKQFEAQVWHEIIVFFQ